MSDGGKGSSPRPYSVSKEQYDKNWEAIFGKNKKEKQEKALDELSKVNKELGLSYDDTNPLIKK